MEKQTEDIRVGGYVDLEPNICNIYILYIYVM